MRRWMVVAVCVCLASPVVAAPITYTFSGSFSGSLGASSFSNAPTTITGYGDTTTVVSSFGGALLTNAFTSLIVTIAGVGSTAVLGFNDIAYSDTGPGFGVNGTSAKDVNGFFFTEYSPNQTYDLKSNLGPVPVSFVFGSAAADTTKGRLLLGIASTPYFTVAVPEPGSLAVLGCGIVGALLHRRRR